MEVVLGEYTNIKSTLLQVEIPLVFRLALLCIELHHQLE